MDLLTKVLELLHWNRIRGKPGWITGNHAHTGTDGTVKILQTSSHESADTDASLSSIHHTLGQDPYEAAPGDHSHNTGVVDKTKFAVTYSASTMKFTVTISAGAKYFINNVPYYPTAATVDSTAHADTTGTHWIYYVGSTLTTGTPTSFATQCPIAYVYFVSDLVTPRYVLFDERHPNTWPAAIWANQHQTIGAKLISGGTIADYTLDSNTGTAFSIAETVIDDESYRHTLTQLASGGPYTVWYRSGLNSANIWSWSLTPTVPFLDDGDNPYYNKLNAGTWSNTAVSVASRWVNYWLCATNAYNDSGNNYKHRFIIIMGQVEHSSAAGAQSEDFLTGISWGVLPFAEIVPLYKVSLRHVNDGANNDAQIDFVTRIVGTNITALSTVSPTSHSALSDRSAVGSHPATAISSTPAGSIAADNVQSAIDELDAKLTVSATAPASPNVNDAWIDTDDPGGAAFYTDRLDSIEEWARTMGYTG